MERVGNANKMSAVNDKLVKTIIKLIKKYLFQGSHMIVNNMSKVCSKLNIRIRPGDWKI